MTPKSKATLIMVRSHSHTVRNRTLNSETKRGHNSLKEKVVWNVAGKEFLLSTVCLLNLGLWVFLCISVLYYLTPKSRQPEVHIEIINDAHIPSVFLWSQDGQVFLQVFCWKCFQLHRTRISIALFQFYRLKPLQFFDRTFLVLRNP